MSQARAANPYSGTIENCPYPTSISGPSSSFSRIGETVNSAVLREDPLYKYYRTGDVSPPTAEQRYRPIRTTGRIYSTPPTRADSYHGYSDTIPETGDRRFYHSLSDPSYSASPIRGDPRYRNARASDFTYDAASSYDDPEYRTSRGYGTSYGPAQQREDTRYRNTRVNDPAYKQVPAREEPRYRRDGGRLSSKKRRKGRRRTYNQDFETSI